MPKISRYVKAFKVEDNNKLMSFHIDVKVLDKYKAIWIKIEDLKKYIELNALPVYDDRYTKTKSRAYCDKVYTNFCDLNMAED